MPELTNSISSQASLMFATQNLKDSSSSNSSYTMFLTLLLSSLLVSVLSSFSNNLSLYIPSISKKLKRLLYFLGIKRRIYKIKLISKRCFTKYGRSRNNITDEKLAVLHDLQKNMGKYEGLHTLEQSFTKTYNFDTDIEKKSPYYKINQYDSIVIYKQGETYMKIKSIDSVNNENDKKDKNDKNDSEITVNKLKIISNKNLSIIKDYINKCKTQWENDLRNGVNRYLFTYLGEDTEKGLIYEEELFVPYAKFSGLVGNKVKFIEDDFDFFQSKEGEKWYKNRNIPYQKTHLYHGIPGTGKSIIACAIAQKYNLHIIRIKLSLIKSNSEFIKVFKNTKINNKTLEFKDVLYLFDELDTELDKLVNKNKNKNNNKDKNNNDSVIIDKIKKEILKESLSCDEKNDDNLTIGTVLEEMNGINQMYGRKMIIITNNFEKLRSIHKGAFVRPGRVDLIIEFKKCRKDAVKQLIINFFPNDVFEKEYENLLKDYEWTPADIANVCKFNKSIKNVIKELSNK